MINVAICDDDKRFADELRQHILNNFRGDINRLEIFRDGTELLSYIDDYNIIFDFVFLDLIMNKLSGIETGHIIRNFPSYHNSFIFFITSYEMNPSTIVDIHPFAYIIKPINYDDFNLNFNNALNLCCDDELFMVFTKNKNTIRVNPKDIIYFEGGYRSTSIHTKNGISTINITLKNIEKQINEKSCMFSRINTKNIINLRYLNETKKNYIVLNDRNHTQLPLTRTYQTDFINQCSEFLIH